MEKLTPVIDQFCTFPILEKRKLFRRVMFCFITGNEDMHLKNFSLISRGNKVELSPAYDLLNSSIAIKNSPEELALPLAGKKRKISKEELVDYYGIERLDLNTRIIGSELHKLFVSKIKFEELIKVSFLSDEMKEKYQNLILERYKRIFR